MFPISYLKRDLYRALKAIPAEDLWAEDAELMEVLEMNRDLVDCVVPGKET